MTIPEAPDGTSRGLSGNTFTGPAAVQVGPHGTQINYFEISAGHRSHLIGEYAVPSQLDVEWMMEQPSRLLDARSQVVPFVGRESELQQLEDWRDSGTARLSVLLLHAPGGQGKTRLATEFAERSRSQRLPEAQQWHVLQAGLGASSARAQPPGSAPAHDNGAGVLLIVDYADRWAHSELATLLSHHMLHQLRPTRVLLIGRTVRWFAALRGWLSDQRAAVHDVLLSPLTKDRLAMFAAARDRFSGSDLYDLRDHDAVSVPAALAGHPDFGLTLTVHMAALVAVDAHHRGTQVPATPHELSAYLLDREYQAWQRLFEAGAQGQDFRTRPAVMARAVFTATLTGAVDQPSGTRAIRQLDLPGHPQDLLVDHRFCYPPADRELVLEPLYPDRLAEDFIALFTPGHDVSAYDPDPWATGVPTSLLTNTKGTDTEGLRPIVVARAMTFLASAAERWPHVGTKVLYPLLRAEPALAVEAGSAALTILAAIDDLPDDVLTSIEQLLPAGRHVDLDIGAAAIASTSAVRALPRTDDPATKADIHLALSNRLANAGRRGEALEHSGRAVELRQQLAAASPDRFGNRTALARALTNYAIDLSEAGRHDEALQHVQRAVELLPNPDAPDFAERALDNALEQTLLGDRFWAEDLADAIDNLATRLARVGQRAQALAFSGYAVSLYEGLAATEVDRGDLPMDRAAWAMVLDNHASRLRQMGKPAEALSFSQQAVDLCEQLAESDRAAHLPALATSMNNHSIRLGEVGRCADALGYIERAVALRGELVELNRTAFLPDLASSTDNLALRLSGAGQHAQAVVCAGQAVDMYGELATATPSRHLPKYAVALGNYSTCLKRAGREVEALACSERAVALFEDLNDDDRAAHLQLFAGMLHNHAALLQRAGRSSSALTWWEKAIHVREELAAETEGPAGQLELAYMLYQHALRLGKAKRFAEAASFSERAVTLQEELVDMRSPEEQRKMATWLRDHAILLKYSGRPAESYAAAERAFALQARLAEGLR